MIVFVFLKKEVCGTATNCLCCAAAAAVHFRWLRSPVPFWRRHGPFVEGFQTVTGYRYTGIELEDTKKNLYVFPYQTQEHLKMYVTIPPASC